MTVILCADQIINPVEYLYLSTVIRRSLLMNKRIRCYGEK